MNRHLLFHSGCWELDLVVSHQDGKIRLLGQILPGESADEKNLFNAVAVLARDERVVQTTTVSSRGEFEFRNVPNSDLKIELFLNTQHLTASFRP